MRRAADLHCPRGNMEHIRFVAAVGTLALTAAGYKLYDYYAEWKRQQKRQRLREKEKECERLREDIEELRRHENFTFRFLFFGITSHGKSTLCNGVLSAFENREYLSDIFQAGGDGSSFTKGFCPCKLADRLWLIDMGGIFESNKIDVDNLRNVIDGNVPFYAHLGSNLQQLDSELIVPAPETNDLACVTIVMKPDTEITPSLKHKFKVIEDCAARGGVSRRLVVTHIEQIDPQFEDPKNLVNIEKSAKIKQCRNTMSRETSIPETSIAFVRNYWDQDKTDVFTNYSLLKFLKQLMQSGLDARRRVAERGELKNIIYQRNDLES